MNEIKCPRCGEVFKVDASGYADIVKQVRDAEFSRDLDERVKAVQREGEQALELERSRSAAAPSSLACSSASSASRLATSCASC